MDKLISAEHFIKSIQLLLSKSSLGEISPQTELTVGEIATLIENEPAAFDKEKVVRELKEELKLSDDEKERCTRENPLQFDSAKGYSNGIANAIEIVEKGGVD